MKTKVTLTRVYKKVVTIEVDEKLLEGKTEEEIGEFLFGYEFGNEDALFEKAEYQQISFNEDSLEEADTDRFDIYNKKGKQIYGGHM